MEVVGDAKSFPLIRYGLVAGSREEKNIIREGERVWVAACSNVG